MAVTDIAMAGVAALIAGMAGLVLVLRALDRGGVPRTPSTRRPERPGPFGINEKEGYAGPVGYGRPPGYGPPPLWSEGDLTDQTAAEAPGTGRPGTA